jgi:hypothetical protein
MLSKQPRSISTTDFRENKYCRYSTVTFRQWCSIHFLEHNLIFKFKPIFPTKREDHDGYYTTPARFHAPGTPRFDDPSWIADPSNEEPWEDSTEVKPKGVPPNLDFFWAPTFYFTFNFGPSCRRDFSGCLEG